MHIINTVCRPSLHTEHFVNSQAFDTTKINIENQDDIINYGAVITIFDIDKYEANKTSGVIVVVKLGRKQRATNPMEVANCEVHEDCTHWIIAQS